VVRGTITDMYPRATVDQVLGLCRPGRTTRDVARTTGIPESTVAHWRRGDRRSGPDRAVPCPRCGESPLPVDSYAYLLGSYLGDGHITRGRGEVHYLSIACADTWPGVMSEVATAMAAMLGSSVCRVQREGCSEVKSCSTHWPCLFPQHGPGRKHTRRIALEAWQQEIVDEHAGRFLRGLFHSDGCRITNWARRPVTGARYEYPRYFFSNESRDIMGLCAAGLDRLGIAYRLPKPNTLSVARREAVAALDEHVGPKY